MLRRTSGGTLMGENGIGRRLLRAAMLAAVAIGSFVAVVVVIEVLIDLL